MSVNTTIIPTMRVASTAGRRQVEAGTSTAVRFSSARSRRVLSSSSLAFSTAISTAATVATPWPKTRGQVYLQGAFTPVKHELFEAELAVEGQMPLELNGVYIRNGPNPFIKPKASYHWFDGDGMLHACRIKEGKVTYCNRFIETSKLKQERAAGRAIILEFGDLHGMDGVWAGMMAALQTTLGIIQNEMGIGNVNTSVVFAANKILATHEADLPYQIHVLDDGMIESSERLSLPNWKQNFTAHPKLNPETGELYFFGYDSINAPYVTYGRLTPEGRVDRVVPITLPRFIIMHDFAVTQRHAIFFDLPLCADPMVMLKENKLPMAFRPDLPARFGLLPLDARSERRIRWFDLPPCIIMHTVNAFELPNGLIKLYVGRFGTINLDLGKYGEDVSFLTEFTLDPGTGTVSSCQLSNVPCDFPVMNPSRTGRPSQYTWMAIMNSDDYIGQFRSIGKFKLDTPEGTDACVRRIDYEPGWLGGEAAFVPRFEDPRQCAGEDDGFLLVYLTHATNPLVPSKLVVYDACTMAPQSLATVALPGRVPLGFHGLFVNERQLQASLAAVKLPPKEEGGTSGAVAIAGREARPGTQVLSPV